MGSRLQYGGGRAGRARNLAASVLLVVAAAGTVRTSAAEPALLAHWRFDEPEGEAAIDSVSDTGDAIQGRFKRVSGIAGGALKLDGVTCRVLRRGANSPKIIGPFSIQAWVALAAYPWNSCAVVEQHEKADKGFTFGIDAEGRLRLALAAGGEWRSAVSPTPLPLRQWVHVAGVFDPAAGISLYVNGEAAGHTPAKGNFAPAGGADLLLGANQDAERPLGAIRPDATLPVRESLDAVIEEVRIHEGALTAADIAQMSAAVRTPGEPPLTARVLPSGPPGAGSFGAFHARLKYDAEWDALWPVGDHPDVVVRFDGAPYRFVFWRGTNYVPCWVTEEGIWYTNEFNETWGHGAVGCAEPMSDKQCRYSHVRIIENSDARVVIHWRYALADIRYTIARVDPETGWGDWSDELYTLYPDGTGVRKITLHSARPMEPHEFQDSITIHNPGHRPDDDIDTDALTLLNMAGEAHTYSWADGPPAAMDRPQKANIQLVNLKSRTKPFFIVSDAACTVSAAGPRFRAYRGEIRRERSIFPWWNHWPTAWIASDGRCAFAADRPSHSCLTNQTEWADHEVTSRTRTRIMLHGLTDRPGAALVSLARSWLRPAPLAVSGAGFSGRGYDPAERAFIVARDSDRGSPALTLELAGSEASPLVNPALIVEGWGETTPTLHLDGKPLRRGPDWRWAHRRGLERTDLILWMRIEAKRGVRLSITPADE